MNKCSHCVWGDAIRLNHWPVRDSPEKKVWPLPSGTLGSWDQTEFITILQCIFRDLCMCVLTLSSLCVCLCPSSWPEHWCNQLLSSLKQVTMKCLSAPWTRACVYNLFMSVSVNQHEDTSMHICKMQLNVCSFGTYLERNLRTDYVTVIVFSCTVTSSYGYYVIKQFVWMTVLVPVYKN